MQATALCHTALLVSSRHVGFSLNRATGTGSISNAAWTIDANAQVSVYPFIRLHSENNTVALFSLNQNKLYLQP